MWGIDISATDTHSTRALGNCYNFVNLNSDVCGGLFSITYSEELNESGALHLLT